MSPAPEPSVTDIREALERICASKVFANSARMTRFLRFVVERTLAKRAYEVKEYSIGIEVFDRSPAFDPKIDTIVRVEARRLRKKLETYYDLHGPSDSVRIAIPGPGYVPLFQIHPAKAAASTNTQIATG